MTTKANNLAIQASYVDANGVLQVAGGGTGLTTIGTSGQGLISNGTQLVYGSYISGYSGYSGISGYSGFSGYSGSGVSGYSGFSGSGISGYSGATGATGTSGFSGYSGTNGATGASGFSGFSGAVGASGFSGYSGYSGINGTTGASGISGYSGATGATGTSGFSGYSGYSGTSVTIPTGTVLLFYQAAAPTGWTQVTTQNNKGLRVVSGTGGGTGGSVAFTTAFASQAVTGSISVTVGNGTLAVGAGTFAVGATTLSTAQIASHSHSTPIYTNNGCTDTWYAGKAAIAGSPLSTNAAGGGGSHTHGLTGAPSLSGSPAVTAQSFTGTAINLAVQYIDVIICSKN